MGRLLVVVIMSSAASPQSKLPYAKMAVDGRRRRRQQQGPPWLLPPRSPATTPAAVFVLTYLVWASIHAARKSFSVVKPTLLKE